MKWNLNLACSYGDPSNVFTLFDKSAQKTIASIPSQHLGNYFRYQICTPLFKVRCKKFFSDSSVVIIMNPVFKKKNEAVSKKNIQER